MEQLVNTTKQCTHCSDITFKQPQDHNRDLGWGYCNKCLKTFYEPPREVHYQQGSIYIYKIKGSENDFLVFMAQYCELATATTYYDKAIESILDKYSQLNGGYIL